MFRIVLFQIVVTLLGALVAGLFAGFRGAMSAALGGMAYAVPSALFVLGMNVAANQKETNISKFSRNLFLGEFFKLTATTGFLFAIIIWVPNLHFPLMLAGLVLALKAVFLSIFIKIKK